MSLLQIIVIYCCAYFPLALLRAFTNWRMLSPSQARRIGVVDSSTIDGHTTLQFRLRTVGLIFTVMCVLLAIYRTVSWKLYYQLLSYGGVMEGIVLSSVGFGVVPVVVLALLRRDLDVRLLVISVSWVLLAGWLWKSVLEHQFVLPKSEPRMGALVGLALVVNLHCVGAVLFWRNQGWVLQAGKEGTPQC